MVSGFVTSPWDQSWITSGEAIFRRMASKSRTFASCRIILFQARSRGLFGIEIDLLVVAVVALLQQFDVEGQALEFADEDVEGFRDVELLDRLALDDVLVGAAAARDVVRLDGQDLLERVRGAVGFEGPDFHFTEALSAELRLAAQRLLG